VRGWNTQDADEPHFWARGYFVTTVGADEATIRDYIRRQETEDRRLDQLGMFEE